MARLLRHDATGPIKVEPQDRPAFICACGLTRNLPFCDGSHAACRTEEDGKLYVYDADRREVVEVRSDSPAPRPDGAG